MPHPLTAFSLEANRLLDLVRGAESLPDAQLAAFMENQRRLDFLRDLVGRARILEHCYNSLIALADQYRGLHFRIRALPPDRLPKSLTIGSREWVAQRRANEELVLSPKQNESSPRMNFSHLRAAGVRECNLELALQQLGELLVNDAIPLIFAETLRAIREFSFERWEE